MAVGDIRTVYAVLEDGSQIVRYSRARRWYHEQADGTRIRAFRYVWQAAELARYQGEYIGKGMDRGSYFYKYLERSQNGEPLQPMQRWSRAGTVQRVKRAKAQYDRELNVWEVNERVKANAYSYYLRNYGKRWTYDQFPSSRPKPKPGMPEILKREFRKSARKATYPQREDPW